LKATFVTFQSGSNLSDISDTTACKQHVKKWGKRGGGKEKEEAQ